jgi:glycosyltransferase involved in cell wall biosynthesis
LLRRLPPSLAATAALLVPPLRGPVARLFEWTGRLRRAAPLAASVSPAYGRRLTEMAAALDAGGLPLPPPPAGRSPVPFNGRVVMALYGSEPWLTNGYAVRTRCLLDQLTAEGVTCIAVTRPNFPGDVIAGADAASVEEANRHRYRRLTAPVGLWTDPPTAYIESFASQLAAIAGETGAATVHAASNHIVGLAACLAAERVGATSVYELRGLWHHSTISRRAGWERSETFALHEALERQAALRADRVVVLTEALAAHVRGWGVPAERIAVVPNGVDTARFTPRPRDEALRSRLGAGSASVVVGFLGTFAPYEGLDTLLEAVALLRRRGIDARALLVGDGEAMPTLTRLARRLEVPATFTGRVPFDQVAAHLAACDVCPFPRRDEGACRLVGPLKLGEAMAAGIPVVVADLPPLTEMVDDGRTGLVYGHGAPALAEALTRLARDPALANRLATEARLLAEKSGWHASIRTLLTSYGG